MPTETQLHVGDAVLLTRSGHAFRSTERATVIAAHGNAAHTVLRVRWCDGRETFVPLSAIEVPH